MTSVGLAVITFGILVTRYIKNMQYKKLLDARLSNFAEKTSRSFKSVVSLPDNNPKPWLTMAWWENRLSANIDNAKWLAESKRIMALADYSQRGDLIILVIIALFSLPLLGAFLFDFDILYMLVAGLLLSLAPMAYLLVRANANRRKFIEQLPQAIDLMVSVLRSGFSVPQAVKTVADELPYPCGQEFSEVLRRMNFGQSLGQAFIYSCDKFRCYELDLIRRAVAIQSEIGGSLAELMDKTNDTLKNRLQLVRKVSALTAQSKLTAIIVGFLPFVMGIVLNSIKPGYLYPLFTSPFGRTLLTVAIVLQILGLIIMKRLSTVRI